MSVTNHGDKRVLTAAADLSTKQFYCVKQTTDTACNLCTASTDKVLGTLANKPKSGQSAEIAAAAGGATFKVKLGGTVSAQGELMTDTDGRAIAATGTGNRAFARALQDGVANDVIEVEGIIDRIL